MREADLTDARVLSVSIPGTGSSVAGELLCLLTEEPSLTETTQPNPGRRFTVLSKEVARDPHDAHPGRSFKIKAHESMLGCQ